MKKILIICFLLSQSIAGFSQENVALKKIEDSLKILGKAILYGESDLTKHNANVRFLKLMAKALVIENSFDYPFDSLITIARLKSEDKKFRIINWNLRKEDGTYEYFGFVQVWSSKQKKYLLYPLIDKSDSINNPETQTLEPRNWYGELYYKIVFNKFAGRKYYTLLAWDGNNNESQKKIIDVLTFNSNDKPVFGAPIFKYNKKTYKRIIFEYNATVSMSLKYDKQNTEYGKKKRTMIIFDRLCPADPSLEGSYAFYYPETNIFDSFIFKKGKWNFVKDVDARNPGESKEERKRRQQIIKEQKAHNQVKDEKVINSPYFHH